MHARKYGWGDLAAVASALAAATLASALAAASFATSTATANTATATDESAAHAGSRDVH